MGLAQTPVDWPVALFVALPLLLWLLDGTRGWKGGFALGWLAGVGYFASTLFWIVEPFLVDVERHGWMAPFALVFTVGGMALFWAVPFAAARALWDGSAARILVLASLWTASEYARSHLFGGFPWALIAYGWVETPVIQTAALIGRARAGVPHPACRPPSRAALALGGAGDNRMVASGWGWGAWRLAQPVPERAEPFVVRLVQPNVAQDVKWLASMQDALYRRLIEATAAGGIERPDVVIWPETAVPVLLGETGWFEAEAGLCGANAAHSRHPAARGGAAAGTLVQHPGGARRRRRDRGALRQAPPSAVRRVHPARRAAHASSGCRS